MSYPMYQHAALSGYWPTTATAGSNYGYYPNAYAPTASTSYHQPAPGSHQHRPRLSLSMPPSMPPTLMSAAPYSAGTGGHTDPWGTPYHHSAQAQAVGPYQPSYVDYSRPLSGSRYNRSDTGHGSSTSREKERDLIHPALSSSSSRSILIQFDVRKPPKDSVVLGTYYEHRDLPATRRVVSVLRLISRDFPWIIDVKACLPGSDVTVGDVWKAMHRGLQEPIKDSEWAFLCMTKSEKGRREQMSRAKDARDESERFGEKSELKRVDWLGKSFVFRGLCKDASFAKSQLLPGTEECADTWVVKMGTK